MTPVVVINFLNYASAEPLPWALCHPPSLSASRAAIRKLPLVTPKPGLN